MKREQKSLTNKGFSLVELIIVVAIMAVLIGVLAPQYLRYVEKTRLQRDNTGIADFANVLKIAATEEDINSEIAAAGATGIKYEFTATVPGKSTPCLTDLGSTSKLNSEVTKTVHLVDVTLTSNTYNKTGVTKPEITVKVDTNGIVSVECANWIDTPNGTTGTTKTF